MTINRYAIIFFLANFFVSTGAFGCRVSAPGFGMDIDKFINQAQTIVLVHLQSEEKVGSSGRIKYTLKTVEVIKGSADKTYQYFTHGFYPHSDEDFGAHTANKFWDDPKEGRSGRFSCGPLHAFREGITYLYFPDILGATKSAEIIRSDDDKWLKYVRSKVGVAANPSINTDAAR